MPMKVYVFNQQKDLSIRVIPAKAIVREVLTNENFVTDEVTVHFVSTEKISQLHQDFFNDPSPTDCISLPIDDADEKGSDYHILGEIFICPHTAIRYLQQSSKKRQGTCPYSETTLYLVHGLLHLLGYNDREAEERKSMRSAEQHHMKQLNAKKLLLKPNTLL